MHITSNRNVELAAHISHFKNWSLSLSEWCNVRTYMGYLFKALHVTYTFSLKAPYIIIKLMIDDLSNTPLPAQKRGAKERGRVATYMCVCARVRSTRSCTKPHSIQNDQPVSHRTHRLQISLLDQNLCKYTLGIGREAKEKKRGTKDERGRKELTDERERRKSGDRKKREREREREKLGY